MFSNLINNRKTSQDRANGNSRLSSSDYSMTADRIRHPHYMSPTSHDREASGSHPAGKQDSPGSASKVSFTGANAPQLPEEMRARHKERQIDHEGDRRARQSSHSNKAAESNSKQSTNHMESSVTRLLVATKMLLEALTKWSLGQRTEEDVSDIYVRLGNDFNSAKLAFSSYGIDMTNLNSVPDDLRDCLEQCLSEEASPPVLEVHLPRIREIIINLLQGLKMKQAEYKQFLFQQRAARDVKRQSSAVMQTIAPADARSLASATSSSHGRSSESSTRMIDPASRPQPEMQSRADQLKRASSAAADFSSSTGSTARNGVTDLSISPELSGNEARRPPSRVTRAISDKVVRRNNQPFPADAGAPVEPPSAKEGATDLELNEDTPRLPSVERHALFDPSFQSFPNRDEEASEASDKVADTPTMMQSPSTQRQYTRSPRHASRPSVDTADGTETDPSLRALKNREALERRASKRFSAYTFNKMGVGQTQTFNQGLNTNMFSPSVSGSPMHDRKTADRRASSSRRPLRPPMPESSPSSESPSPAPGGRTDYFAMSGITRSKSFATDKKIEAIEEVRTPTSLSFPEGETTPAQTISMDADGTKELPEEPRASGDSLSLGRSLKGNSQTTSSNDSLPFVDAQIPSAELVNGPRSDPAQPPVASTAIVRQVSQTRQINVRPAILNVFLQLGRQTRKATIDLDPSNTVSRGITVAKLRMLFVDKFAYSPRKDDFPSIYVKDAESGVSYELEDLHDLVDGSLLTLNIEPLDQVKQHLDLSLGVITRELRELKTVLAERDRDARRMSHGFVNTEHVFVPALAQTPTQISDSQFRAAGERVAQVKRANTRGAAATSSTPEEGANDSGHSGQNNSLHQDNPAPESESALASGKRIAQELKIQFDELQNLRREFAITRQLQDDFEGDVKSVFSTMREQAAKVREIASTKVAAERNFIVAGKAKLDSQSQDLLTLIEDLQDTVDDLKMDVISRGVKPRPALVKQIVEDIDKATSGLLGLEEYVQTVKPSWKRTWETELQNIVDEQEFLNHEEGLMSDLRDDLSGLTEVFSNIQQVVKLRGGSSKGGKYIPPLPEQGHEGLSTVMLEVKGQAVNHEKRLRALQAVERQRQKDLLTNKSQDEFTEELAGFVDKKVLRKTGGVLEAERVRQRRDHATWKAMFGGGGSGGAPLVPSPSGGPPSVGNPNAVLDKPRKLVLGKKAAPPSTQQSSHQAQAL